MSSTRRQRTDTAAGAQEIYEGAQQKIEPPLGIKLDKRVRPYWDLLVESKAARGWTPQDLLLLVELSHNLHRTHALSRQLLRESPTVLDSKGTPKANPKFGIVDQLVKRARIIYAMLQIHPEATQGKAREQRGQNGAHRGAQQAQGHVEESDGLIPGANLQ